MELIQAIITLAITTFWYYLANADNSFSSNDANSHNTDKLLPANFPSEADTLAYVDALKHSNFSQWRSLEEVAKTAGGGSCSGAVNTSVLTALYLLGLFNLCSASPASCCVPELATKRKRRSPSQSAVRDSLPPLLNSLTQNLSSLSLEQFRALPHVSTPQGGRVPVHISVVEQVRKLWDSNPRLLSNLPCHSATEAVRSSFISLSGVASGIILAYSIAQLNQCYPDQDKGEDEENRIWFFPIPRPTETPKRFVVRSLPSQIPVPGDDDPDDGCDRTSVRMRNGSCAKLLSSTGCTYMQWILLNQETRKGECAARLCPPGKVFVEADQMCHAVGEPGYCPPNQRLYVTAWGEAVCDCEDGMFPGPDKQCHRLYSQAYCYRGAVLQFHKPSKALACKTDPCRALNYRLSFDQLPYAQKDNQTCYQFGSVGPCEDSERFGFDIESLEPSCVGLEEAGLLRSHRSYQYSHMSFPALQDTNFPHYEVSYVIVNGSTWELEMKPVGRMKRDLTYKSHLGNRTVIPFLDTREFPTKIEDVLRGFQSLELVKKKAEETEERTNKLKMEAGSKDRKTKVADHEIHKSFTDFNKFRLRQLEGKKRRAFQRFPWKERRFGRLIRRKRKNEKATIADRGEKKRKLNKRKAKIVEGEMDKNYTLQRKKLTKNNVEGVSEDKEKIIAEIILNKQTKNNESQERRKDENQNKIVIEIYKENSTNCKWHFSFYSENQNMSLVNSTSIDILKHPNSAPFRIERYSSSNNTIEIGAQATAMEPQGRKNNSGPPDEPLTGPHHFVSEENLVLERSVSSQDDSEKFEDEKGISVDTIPKKDELNINDTTTTAPSSTSEVRTASSTRKTLHEQDSPQKAETTEHPTKPTVWTEMIEQEKENGSKWGSNWKESLKHPVSLSPLWNNFENYSSTDSDGDYSTFQMEKEAQGNNASDSKEDDHQPAEKIVKMKQPSGKGTSPNRRRHGKASKKQDRGGAGRKKGSSAGSTKRGRQGHRKKKTKKARRKKGKRKKGAQRSKQKNSRGREGPPQNRRKDSVENLTHPDDDESLPDYLRNRGRRQAGTKRRGRLAPGIITAPLLNQCRPGAKRDYNGHCRPKIIPADKVPPPRKRYKSHSLGGPSPPRMKCKGNQRLDFRGICRTTLSGLG